MPQQLLLLLASAAAVRSMPAARQEPHLGSCAIHLKVLLHSSLIPPSRQRALGIAAPMSQRVNALAPAALFISKICDAQREFDSSIRALNDFFREEKARVDGIAPHAHALSAREGSGQSSHLQSLAVLT